ncbi:Asp-tRNA(Asn)/Glu-tRNA(Gln) amidotransferase subunit GatA [Pseudoflavonifractor phocaeensis]|uniref:Asp-tRNA(Asn)/Glu-tRNA(Gln) amidotransferase subunit GatA n=1 Tax=Pseudoflavonifractor phocaeensis TaxID=1870988 RepID=UPI001957F0C5|nr:Asp-tRNA(Asn)/Glu-tRNA(Gln) amidotransferase subunit GatA [Pseudoflavonifractor phocaeensis]MBM6723365.1 Asp-tRNA(Asn)/Glu-tRNA(Gln) amidotransferase subunit GatA [Pseudoflavonifractor phocaeensis]
MELHTLTALELGEKLRSGEVTRQEAVEAALSRIRAAQGANNAFITVTDPPAPAAEGAVSPLAGVPMAYKDNICTKGVRTTCASRILGDFTPCYDATVAERLTAAGAVSLGKLNMDEFAMGSTSETSCFGAVKNPWDLTRAPGGSSGGAAAAVAAGEVWYAIGSDTGGSIRQPAAYCGVTGMKPTYGTVSRYGLIAYASSLDQMGPIARSAADCAAVLDIMMGKDVRDATSLDAPAGGLLASLTGDLRGKRIGLPVDCFGEGLDPEVRAAVLAAAEVLKARGATVEEFALPVMKYVVPAYYIIACAEASSNLSRFDGVKYGWRAEGYEDLGELYAKTRTQGFGTEVKRRILLGTFVLSSGYYNAYYKKALQTKAVIKAAFDGAFAKYDLLLTPVAPTTAPKLGESLSDPLKMYLSDIYTVSVNLAGLPGLSMPCGFDQKGLPIGAQLIGPALGDAAVLNAAYGYQLDTDYHRQIPKGGDAQ